MKKVLITIIICCLWAALPVFAQERGERIEALKIAFITKQLNLSQDEAQKFWPVYNTYDEEMKKMMQDHRKSGGSELELEEKILGLHKKYKPEFLKVVSEEKFNRLLTAEKSWNEMLRKELQRRRQGQPPGRGNR